MRETVRAFEKRRRQSYQPPAWLLGLGRPLARSDTCPTLFRYPGPCGLRDYFEGALERLGPPGRELWLAEVPLHDAVPGAARFGTLAVLEPLRFSPCRSERPGIYVGVNRKARGVPLVWVPPSALRARIAWDAARTADDGGRALGPGAATERNRVERRLRAYVAEMAALERAGAQALERPWCEIPAAQRRRLLRRHGITPRWTRAA